MLVLKGACPRPGVERPGGERLTVAKPRRLIRIHREGTSREWRRGGGRKRKEGDDARSVSLSLSHSFFPFLSPRHNGAFSRKAGRSCGSGLASSRGGFKPSHRNPRETRRGDTAPAGRRPADREFNTRTFKCPRHVTSGPPAGGKKAPRERGKKGEGKFRGMYRFRKMILELNRLETARQRILIKKVNSAGGRERERERADYHYYYYYYFRW